MDAKRATIIDEVCGEFEAGRVEWSFEYVYSCVERFATTGFLDNYEEGQEDEGDADEAGAHPWDDREGPSEDEGSAEHLASSRACGGSPAPSDLLTPAQKAEIANYEDRLALLTQCQQTAGGEAGVLAAIEKARRQVHAEAAGSRCERDSAVAQAVRRHEQQQRDMAEQLRNEMDTRARERDAQEKVLKAAAVQLEARLAELRQKEAAHALAGQRAEELQKARDKRKALEAVSQGFTMRELGQGLRGGGNPRCRRNRLDLVNKVCRLGADRPPEVEVNWSRWQDRFDAEGVRRYGAAWAFQLKRSMGGVIQELVSGEDGVGGNPRAFLQFYRRISREWLIAAGAAGDVVVPGKAS